MNRSFHSWNFSPVGYPTSPRLRSHREKEPKIIASVKPKFPLTIFWRTFCISRTVRPSGAPYQMTSSTRLCLPRMPKNPRDILYRIWNFSKGAKRSLEPLCPQTTKSDDLGQLPVLLPANVLPKPPSASHFQWKPQRFLSEPQPPPQDDGKLMEQDLANVRQMIDGKLIKKTRPRRTVDYNGGVGRWALVHRISFLGWYGCWYLRVR